MNDIMNNRWHAIRIIKGTDANKVNCLPDLAHFEIVAPDGNTAFWTTEDILACPAWGSHGDFINITLSKKYPVRFDQCKHSKGTTRLSLAPPTVTAMHKQRL